MNKKPSSSPFKNKQVKPAFEQGDIVKYRPWRGEYAICKIVSYFPHSGRFKYVLEDIVTGERVKNPQLQNNLNGNVDPRDIVAYKKIKSNSVLS